MTSDRGKITIKTKKEVEIMKEGGKITSEARRTILDSIKPGIKTKVLDRIAEKMILKMGGEPSFKTVRDYKFATCINVNEGVVHGLPGNRKIQEGDLVTVDLGALYKGLHTDSGWTVEVKSPASGSGRPTLPIRPCSVPDPSTSAKASADRRQSKVKSQAFLEVGERALERAIGKCRVGNYLGDVSNVIQETVENAGYSVIRKYVGHGIGEKLHEPPEIPGFGKKGTGPKLAEGMVLAIEVIYAESGGDTKVLEDGWTAVTTDLSNAALFEHTIAVTSDGPIVLTE